MDAADVAMTARADFVAVDWGTSSLRAWAMAADGSVVAETRSADGMGTLTPDGFEPVLRARLADLAPAIGHLAAPLPVLLCGMVGARQGWREAPYAAVPAGLDAIADATVALDVAGLDARILPGLCRRDPARPDVMRGEETQLLGLVLADADATGAVCMPGTHSKWVRLEAGRVVDFATVMTGELFAVVAGHSILRHTLAGSTGSGDPASPAFLAGLRTGLEAPELLPARLFSIRAESLLFGAEAEASADRLSGLLIGAEIGAGLSAFGANGPVTLVASGRHARLYGAAFEVAGRPAPLVDADAAVRAGLTHAARRLWPARVTA